MPSSVLMSKPVTNDYSGLNNLAVFPVSDIEGLAKWAEEYKASRKHDVTIGDDYLRRWWIIPRNDYMNIYLHQLNHDDDDRALHDHPADNISLVISGGYTEVTPDGVFERKPGDVIHRKAGDAHRLELKGEQSTSLFYMGPKYRQWGFHCPDGWVQWNKFVDPDDPTKAGPGCGD